ncbi:MAG: FAD-binding oxidoreductase [Acidobacteria bacterium]|nr:FAD-binding oxidoreductase [Acidobacteriota bacterium]
MLVKSNTDEIQSYLTDASNIKGGHAARVLFPDNATEIAEALREASQSHMPVTISGAGSGITGGRVPFGGIVLATDRLSQIVSIEGDASGGRATLQAGVNLRDLQSAAAARGLFYPPDPTEWSCFIGGSVSTNASGARTFKYGPTRNYVRRLQIVLTTGEILELQRGQIFADAEGRLKIPLPNGRIIETRLPAYQMPQTRKHAAGYFVAPGMDVIDLFIGSEGTLGVITEVEVDLLLRPAGMLSGVVFFTTEADVLAFVRAARARSLQTRRGPFTQAGIDARALEYFDDQSLNFMRSRNPRVPEGMAGAVFFEQEVTPETEDALMNAWLELLEQNNACLDESWFAVNESDQQSLRDFRHELPVSINEWIARHKQRKVATDIAVPDESFATMLRFYQEVLRACGLQYVIFGHIGDNHVHVNILPRDAAEAAQAHELYGRFIQRGIELGGTISAEHGIGKLKREYLQMLYGEAGLQEMAKLKLAFDPAGILGRGNLFAEQWL